MNRQAKLLPKDDPMLLQDVRKNVCPPELRDKVIADLQEIYNNPPWGIAAGMAAPQIGYPYNVFIAQGQVFENVSRILRLGRPYHTTETCFSLPNEVHRVERYWGVKVKIGDTYTVYEGRQAQIIQHEFDHILGKLINGKEGK